MRFISVGFRDEMIWITLADGHVIGAPLARYPWLEVTSDDERRDFRVGAFSILWEALEDGIDIEGLLSSELLVPRDANGQPPNR